MHIWKMYGGGSAFDPHDRLIAASQEPLREIVQTMKDDQFIAIESDFGADAFLRCRNADRREVTTCGGATRAVARRWDKDPDNVATRGPVELEKSFTD